MKPIVVGINEVNISTEEQPVIGTDSLGSCVGVLIYSEKYQKSVVFHTSTNWQKLAVDALIILADNKLISEKNLGTSIDILNLYEEYNMYDFENELKNKLLEQQGLKITDVDNSLELIIIPGYYKDHYRVTTNMMKYFSSLFPLLKVKISSLQKKAIRTRMVEDLGSHEFFFDSKTGEFVTDKIHEPNNYKNTRTK